MSLYDLGDVVKLQLATFDANGDPADAGAAALTITKPDGTTATVTPIAHTNGTGLYDATFTPTLLGAHTARWAATGANQAADVRRFDVYGATICEPAEMRARYADLTVAKYSDAALRKALRAAVEQWNKLAGVSMAPFATRLARPGNGRGAIALPDHRIRSILAVTIDGTPLASDDYYLEGASMLTLVSGIFPRGSDVVIRYEHGYDTPPGTVVDAVMQRAFELAVPSEFGSGRVTSVANDLGFQRLSIAGRDGSTGIPDFDATAALFGAPRGKRVGSTITSPYGSA